ncbi:MAG: hypothetical protein FJ216_09655 [Ignavibacteria bacterium]|nr:hypothetical protein [Ignavibacteria bacterium]
MSQKIHPEIAELEKYKDLKQIYSAIDELKEIIPHNNERNRLSFCINMFKEGKIDNLFSAIEQADPRSSKLNYPDLEKEIIKLFEVKKIILK